MIGRTGPLVAGWLFADLLLVLFLLALGAAPAAPAVDAAAPPPPVATPPVATPAPAGPPGLDPRTVVLTFEPGFDVARVQARDPGEVARVAERVRAASAALSGRRAGVVLVFSKASASSTSTAYSKDLIPILATAAPGLLPSETSLYRPYFSSTGSVGSVTVELFLYR